MPPPCEVRHGIEILRARVLSGRRHGKETAKIGETNCDEAIQAEVLALDRTASRADARTLRLDHAHGARQPRSGSDESLVRQGPGVDVQTELSHARRRRVPPICLLRQGRWGNSPDRPGRDAGQQLQRTRRGYASRIRESAAGRSRGDGPAHAGDAGCDHRGRTRTWRSPDRVLRAVVKMRRRRNS